MAWMRRMVPKSAGATSLATCGTFSVAFYVDGFDYRSYGSIGKYRSIFRLMSCSGFPHDLLICYYLSYIVILCLRGLIVTHKRYIRDSCVVFCFSFFLLYKSSKYPFSRHMGHKCCSPNFQHRNIQVTFRPFAVLCP